MKHDKKKYEEINCLVCGSRKYKTISTNGQFKIPLFVSTCENCGLVYLNPRWKKEIYNNFYKTKYDKFYRANTPNKENGKQIWKRIKNKIKITKSSKILDIGCGEGEVLDFLKKETNAKTFGVEPSNQANKKITTNHKIIAPSIEKTKINKKFDLIIMRHVLEHLLDLKQSLNKINSLLNKNGLLYIAVPTLNNPSKPIRNDFYRVVHTTYFSEISLTNILKITNFKIIYKKISPKNNLHEMYFLVKKANSKQKIKYESYEQIITFLKTKSKFDKLIYFKNKIINIIVQLAKKTNTFDFLIKIFKQAKKNE